MNKRIAKKWIIKAIEKFEENANYNSMLPDYRDIIIETDRFDLDDDTENYYMADVIIQFNDGREEVYPDCRYRKKDINEMALKIRRNSK